MKGLLWKGIRTTRDMVELVGSIKWTLTIVRPKVRESGKTRYDANEKHNYFTFLEYYLSSSIERQALKNRKTLFPKVFYAETNMTLKLNSYFKGFGVNLPTLSK